ncbi:hypothetical protein GCM10010244_24190 [Streptomyces coeruleorubidus]|nr:hypothetical protein GCM10010244_24190 [Streptomyces bellus]
MQVRTYRRRSRSFSPFRRPDIVPYIALDGQCFATITPELANFVQWHACYLHAERAF